MGRPPSNGAPSFRFYPIEVAQMEAILQKYEGHVPPRDLIDALAQRFSQSPERAGKIVVQMKQIWNWFQNRRYALRAKLGKSVGKPTTSPVTRDEFTQMRNVLHAPQPMAVFSGPHLVRNTSEAPFMEFEARSSRDGAWYDVHEFLSHRYLETGNPEVLVRFSGFVPDEDEWLNIRKHVRQRSLPCEALECIAVLPGDLILCFQEGKEQALYYDAHVLDAQRRRHDLRGCRCRFLVRFDHDQSEEIIPLRKICRRPETDYRLQQLHAANETAASTSIPVIDLTNSSPLGLTNSNPITSPIKVSSSPIMGCGPSVQASSSIGPPTSVLTPAVVATSSVPGTSAVTEIDSNKIDDLSPARIPDPEENKVDEENPAQIPAQVTESSKSETDNPVLVPELNKTETNGSGPVPVHEQFRVEKNIPTPLLEQNKTGNSRQENVSQTTISVPGREKAECSTGPTEEMVE